MPACIVMITTGSHEEAERIAYALVEARLAACVQMQPITSVYRWNGEVGQDSEVLLYCKTVDDRYDSLRDKVLSMHSYETPEIVKVPISGGLDRYVTWLEQETR